MKYKQQMRIWIKRYSQMTDIGKVNFRENDHAWTVFPYSTLSCHDRLWSDTANIRVFIQISVSYACGSWLNLESPCHGFKTSPRLMRLRLIPIAHMHLNRVPNTLLRTFYRVFKIHSPHATIASNIMIESYFLLLVISYSHFVTKDNANNIFEIDILLDGYMWQKRMSFWQSVKYDLHGQRRCNFLLLLLGLV